MTHQGHSICPGTILSALSILLYCAGFIRVEVQLNDHENRLDSLQDILHTAPEKNGAAERTRRSVELPQVSNDSLAAKKQEVIQKVDALLEICQRSVGKVCVRGPPGPPGKTGAQGQKGKRGKAGQKARRGSRGPPGIMGLPGRSGKQGMTGPLGMRGEKGDKGDSGPQGMTGPLGMRGEKGDNGDAGPQGMTGPLGMRGEKGDKGNAGPQGMTGPLGMRGEKGDKGDAGRQGMTGPLGMRGEKGDKGDAGPQGMTGPLGMRGEKGDKGNAGPQGPPGPKGGPETLTNSEILRGHPDYVVKLKEYLAPVQASSKHWKLCFRASTHQYSSSAFHAACDHKGPTVTLVRVGNYVFGGYADKSWNANGDYIRSTAAFLFSLKNHLNQQYKMLTYRHLQYAIYNKQSYGPTFGGGHSLRISDKCNANTNSYTNLGHTYRPPNGYAYTSSQARNLLAGSYHFKCDEYEVFYQV